MGATKRRHLAGNASPGGLHDDHSHPADKTAATATRQTDDRFDDVYPEASSRSTRPGHDTFRDDRHEARADRYPQRGSDPITRATGDDIGTFPETSRMVTPVPTTAAASGSTASDWSDEPIITRAGEMPASVRAAAARPATTRTAMTTTGSRTMTADRGTDYRSTAAPTVADRGVIGRRGTGRPGRRGPGGLVSDVVSDMSMLLRQEVDLARAEVRQSAVRAGKGAGMLGGAAGAGAFAVLFLLLAAMFGLSTVMALGWAALIVGVLLAVSAGILGLLGRANVKKAHAKPTQTVETLKEDMQWAHGLRK
jgi:hypothetical protein